MVTKEEYAQLSLYVYNAKRNDINQPNLPDRWKPLEYVPNGAFGFSYGVFQKDGTNEVVIAYTGTQMTDVGDVANDLAGGVGIFATQAMSAASVYIDAKQKYGTGINGADISFTGHSLGGGLASMMAIWFDSPATVFDEAPFALLVRNPWFTLATKLYVGFAADPAFASYDALINYAQRESNVTNYYVEGEFLNAIRTPANNIVGSGQDNIVNANIADMSAFAGAVDLHSQALLTAMLMSDEFRQSTYASTRIIPLLMDKGFYASDAGTSNDQNVLINFIRGEQGAEDKLTHFAADMETLRSNIANLPKEAQDALIAQAIEWHYWQKTGMPFFSGDSGMLQYTTAKGAELPNAENRAAAYIQKWLAPIVNAHGEFYTSSFADFQQWNVVTGSGADGTALDTAKSQIFIGGSGADNFTGGELSDLMFAGDGSDTLTGNDGDDRFYGGLGADTLSGGTGYDRYVIEGADTVEDSDGEGILTDNNGRHISGMIQKREDGTYVSQSDSIVSASGGSDLTLTLADGSSVTVKNYQDGDLGIQLFKEEALSTTFDRTIVGDLVVSSTQKDDIGNYIPTGGASPGRNDGLQDSAGNDLIKGLGGNDNIYSWRGGDDQIDGGDGDDWMIGGMGQDIVIGGAGRDVLVEGGDDDKLYADNVVTLESAIAAQNSTPSGVQGEALSGGSGDDMAIGGTGNDVLFGGVGDDILVAGAGDDNIDGDVMADNIMANWSTQRSITSTAYGTSYSIAYNQFNMTWPTVGGDDVIYAGAGEDWVTGGYGNDYIDGGNHADILWGEGGNDDVFGGAGNDLINGDNARLSITEQGDDYLDGEEGDDVLQGEGGSDQLFGGAGNDKLYADNADGSGAGYDYLDGEAGDDELLGGALDDELFGGEGNDFLQGDSGTGSNDGDDYLDGEAGDDILLGEGGKDEIHGGDGADQIAGDNGGYDTTGDADTIYGGAGDDYIDGQCGDDVIDAGADNDVVAGGAGNDLILGGDGEDQLQGGDGDDVLEGGAGADVLFGESGNDTLRGGDGTDYLLGGMGDDILDGGAGDDVYYYSTGEGNDRIADSGGTDWLVFTDINWGQITLGIGSLKLNLPNGAELHLDDFDPDNPYAAGGIEYFQFADGSVLTKNQLINALGIQPTGTPEADMLTGTALAETIHALAGDDVVTARAGNDSVYAEDGADVVYGGDGNDIIYGGNDDDVLLGENGNDTLNGEAGNDLLCGGSGTDALQGGDGNDTYLFQSGDGQDTATDALGTNTIVLGSGLTLDAIVFTRQGSDLLVAVKNSTDRLTVKDWFAADSHFASITLGDGTPLDHAGVEAAMPRNQAPVVTLDTATVVEDSTTYVSGNALTNDSDPEGRTLRITNAGNYAGTVGTLSLGSTGAYSYTLANSSQAVQSLAAGQSLTESFAYTVTDDDPNGAAMASSSIRITVQGANDLPTLGADSTTTSEDAGRISGNVLTNDTDIDAGTILTVANPGQRTGTYGSLTLGSDGAWGYSLANTSTTVQSLAAGQTVTDNFSFNVNDGLAQVGGSLSVSITGQNDAPILVTPLADQSASANSSWNWQLPTGSFADVDAGDVLGYTASLANGSALPSWLTFNAATQTFAGRVPKSATGSIDIRIAATDRQGAAAADVFTLSFAAGSGGGGGGGGNGGGNNGGGSQGNEGVGNGADGPPPGHDTSFNDGTGTSPGNPGAQGGNGYVPPKRADILLQDVQVNGRRMAEAAAGNERGNSADAHASAPGQVKQDSAALADTEVTSSGSVKTNNGNANGQDVMALDATSANGQPAVPKWLQEAAWTYLDTRGSDASYASTGSGGDTVTTFMQWLAVQQAMADQGRIGLPDWLDVRQGADLRGMILTDGRFLGSSQASGNDPLSLQAAASLQSFSGLGNGTQKIA